MTFREKIEPIGEVHYVFNKNAKRMNLTVRGMQLVRVAIPMGVSVEKARSFVLSKQEWINRQKQLRKEQFEGPFINKPFKTRYHTIYIHPQKRHDSFVKLENETMNVYVPDDLELESPFVQKTIAMAKEMVYEKEAIYHIPERMFSLASDHGFKFRDFDIRKTKRSWGSCNRDGIIRISCYVMKLPDELIDFVILHELCHLKFFNHSPEFKKLLDTITGGRRDELEKKLKQYKTT